MVKYVQRSLVMMALMVIALSSLSMKMNFDYADVFHGLNGKMQTVIVVDVGHGGYDPGKIGVSGSKEKDLNLEIALKLKRNLEHQGMTVILTRDGDYGLYSADSSNKKREDMRERVKIINQSGAVLAVSIHQNSFTDGKYSGAQVFFYKGSKEGEKLAKYIQQSFALYADETNQRQEKANSDYYLLKNSEIPMVIAECGFLSNAAEEAKLLTEEYQEKVAWAIHMGVMQYLSEDKH